MKIVFFGTPEFAVTSLAALTDAGMDVAAVVTAPDKPAGRGRQLQGSPVKTFALSRGLPVLQPEKLKSPDFLEQLAAFQPQVQVVVAFRMLPEAVWNLPPLGTINVHASLLPQYRGAAPINHVLMNGETRTGVTTFRLQHEIDTGGILLQQEIAIADEDTAGTLHDKLMHAGAALLVRTLRGLDSGELEERPQEIPPQGIKYAPKLFAQDREIRWDRPVRDILNQVRGLSPYPAAYTLLNGRQVKIFRVHILAGQPDKSPGAYDTDGQTTLRIAAKDGWVYLDELQMEGKKRLPVTDFLRGFR